MVCVVLTYAVLCYGFGVSAVHVVRMLALRHPVWAEIWGALAMMEVTLILFLWPSHWVRR